MLAPSHRNSTDPAESLQPNAHSHFTIADPFSSALILLICGQKIQKLGRFGIRKAQEKGTRRIKNALFIDTTDFAGLR
jgi:hypothetical protein